MTVAGSNHNPRKWAPGTGWAIGVPVGVALGLVMGSSMDDTGAGLALGVGIGVAAALIFEKKFARIEARPLRSPLLYASLLVGLAGVLGLAVAMFFLSR